jgi:hypothetical protein
MGSVQTWGGVISTSLIQLWNQVAYFLPVFFGAILVFILGVLVASAIGKVIERLVKVLRIDSAIEHLNINEKLKHIGIEIEFSVFLGKLVQWFLVLIFLMAATDILGLKQVTAYLNSIILYVPNIVVATIILTIAFILGGVSFKIVRGSTRAAGVMSATLLAMFIKWAIIIFGILAALIQLGIATSLVNTIFVGVVAAFSLAIGLAFGLGGKEEAALILKKIRMEITEKK